MERGDEAGAGARLRIERIVTDAVASGRPLCLDSGPLIDYLAGQQPIANLVDGILRHAELLVIVSTISFAEIIVQPVVLGGRTAGRAIYDRLGSLPGVRIIDFDQRHALEAAVVRAETDLKLPDAAIVATARLADAAALIGNDRQWRHKPLGLPYLHMDDIMGDG